MHIFSLLIANVKELNSVIVILLLLDLSDFCQPNAILGLRFKLLLPFGLVTLARQGGNCWECRGVYGTGSRPCIRGAAFEPAV